MRRIAAEQPRTGGSMKASALCFRAAVLFVLIGMSGGIAMAISQNHAAMPAHAHLNLVGWVSLFLFGVYYRLHPFLERSRTALLQAWVWIVGTVVMIAGVGLIYTGHPEADPIAAIGSVILLFGMLVFGWIVYRGSRTDEVRAALRVAAE
jgi:peptidoglycan/LPS O-acetylase OafA/YrhL